MREKRGDREEDMKEKRKEMRKEVMEERWGREDAWKPGYWAAGEEGVTANRPSGLPSPWVGSGSRLTPDTPINHQVQEHDHCLARENRG